MVAVVDPAAADTAVRLLTGRGVPAWVAGTVAAGGTGARLVGTYR
jgi:phosphoribosylformylglycinamidine cyclo-ligase